jgi:hypothetical protein
MKNCNPLVKPGRDLMSLYGNKLLGVDIGAFLKHFLPLLNQETYGHRY